MSKNQHWFVAFIVFFAAMGGIIYGYDLGIIAGALLFIHKSIPMTDMQSSFLVSSVLGGGAIATLISGPLADLFSRRLMIIVATLIFLAGVFLLSFAHHYSEILMGRLTQGIGIGIITITIPLYLSESLPKHIRGRGMSVFQLLLTFGILLASLVGLFYAPTENWRAMFLSAGIPGIILFIGAIFLPNSPHWLLMKKRDDQALAVLRLSRHDAQAQQELLAMQQSMKNHQNNFRSLITNLRDRKIWYPILIVFSVASLQQLSGINSFLQFSAYLLQQAGLKSNITAMLGNTVITCANFIITIVALFLIDRLGRTKLLSFGTGGMVVALIFSGLVYFYFPYGLLKGYLLLLGMTGFILTYGVGPGIVVWLVLSELLPNKVRSSGMAAALFINSMMSSIFASLFLTLTHHIGYVGVFYLCAFFSFLYFCLAYFVIPETNNKTLEEIEDMFRAKSAPKIAYATAET
jgi:SP family galactose:H+ symporter-like MFS transporter